MIQSFICSIVTCMAVICAPAVGAQPVIEMNPTAKTWSLNGTIFTSKSKPTDVLSALGGANRTIEAANRTQYVFDSLGVLVEESDDGLAVRVFLGPSIRSTEPLKKFSGTLTITGVAITAAHNIGEVKAKTPAIAWTDLMGKTLMFAGKGVIMMVDTRSGKVNDVGFGFKN